MNVKMIINPSSGKGFTIEDDFLTNIPKNADKPPTENWEYYLFGRLDEKPYQRLMIVLQAKSERAIISKFRRFVRGAKVVKNTQLSRRSGGGKG